VIFATPTIVIAGVIATVIPIAIHLLFHKRKKPIEWAAMNLLLQAIQRTTRRRQINRLILLALRCCVVVLAAIAVAGLVFQQSKNSPANTTGLIREIILVLDDGIAQQTKSGNTNAFENSRAQAVDAIGGMNPGDRVGLILAAGARPLVWPPSDDLSAAMTIVQATEVSYSPSDIGTAIATANNSTRAMGVISEFRRGSTIGMMPEQFSKAAKGGPKVFLSQPNQTEVNNVQVVSFVSQARGPLSSRSGIPLRVKLRREGGRLGAEQSQIDITADDNTRTSLRVDWNEGQVDASIDGAITVQVGRRTEIPLRASLVQRDNQPADDARFSIIPTAAAIRVGIIDRAPNISHGKLTDGDSDGVGAWVERALRPSDEIDIETEVIEPTAMNAQRCKGFDAIIIIRPDAVDGAGWTVLSRLVQRGLVLMVIPPSQTTNTNWSDGFLKTFDLGWTISREVINSDPPTNLRRLDVPNSLLLQIASELTDLMQPIRFNRFIKVVTPINRGETVLEFDNNSPFLVRTSSDGARGSILLFAAPPDLRWTNLPAKPLMVPLFQELIRQSIAQVDKGRHMAVGGERLPTPIAGATGLRLSLGREQIDTRDQRVISVDPNGNLAQPITQPGVYTALDSSEKVAGWVVVNIEPAAASTQPTTIDEIAAILKGVSVEPAQGKIAGELLAESGVATAMKSKSPEIPLAKALDGYSLAVWFFTLVLLLLLVETWFARSASTGAILPKAQGETP